MDYLEVLFRGIGNRGIADVRDGWMFVPEGAGAVPLEEVKLERGAEPKGARAEARARARARAAEPIPMGDLGLK